jgi:hypothetical protein
MAKIFGKHNNKQWIKVDTGPNTIGYGEQPIRKPDRTPTPPAPEDLFNMAIEAIRKQSLMAVEEMERSGQHNNDWKLALEEVVYSGAFSEDQQKVFHELFSEVSHHVAVAHARVLTTRILCGATEQPKGVGFGDAFIKNQSGSIVAASNMKSIWK